MVYLYVIIVRTKPNISLIIYIYLHALVYAFGRCLYQLSFMFREMKNFHF